jgi:hypothetical protein
LKSIEIETINDFPKLKLSQIRRRITFGSFKIRQCQSFIDEIIKYGQACLLEKKHIDNYISISKNEESYENLTVIAILIASRHSRAK